MIGLVVEKEGLKKTGDFSNAVLVLTCVWVDVRSERPDDIGRFATVHTSLAQGTPGDERSTEVSNVNPCIPT